MTRETILCPSAPCQPGAVLVGIVMSDGRVAYSSDRLVVDEEFVQVAQQGRTPESRFRFASPCVQGACKQWTGQRCGVIDRVVELLPEAELLPASETIVLPACSIRPQCRWYEQAGPTACLRCPLVITDARA